MSVHTCHADGCSDPCPPQRLFCRPCLGNLATLRRRWRDAEASAVSVACPFCGAAANIRCGTKSGRNRTSHVQRVEVHPGRPSLVESSGDPDAWMHG